MESTRALGASGRHGLRAFLLGLLASLFFAFTFILNRQMDLEGGSWLWSASLRYLFMLPLLVILLLPSGGLGAVLAELRARPLPWLLWSQVGFGLFYAPLCLAAGFGPSWLLAAAWQLTIVAGALLGPFLAGRDGRGRRPLPPWPVLLISLLILAGIGLLQLGRGGGGAEPLLLLFLVLVAAIAYPAGNRKTMELAAGRLSTPQRVLAMCLASLPLWLLLALAGFISAGPPGVGQLLQVFLVALFSGLVATLLFFEATRLVRGDQARLAAVESTQAGEILFSLLGGLLVFHDEAPSGLGLLGLGLVVLGMLLNSLFGARREGGGRGAKLRRPLRFRGPERPRG